MHLINSNKTQIKIYPKINPKIKFQKEENPEQITEIGFTQIPPEKDP